MLGNRTGFEKVVVKSGTLTQGPDSNRPEVNTAIDAGQDDLMFVPAWDEVREEVDPEDHEEGTHVATIHYDMDAKNYNIEYYVETKSEKEQQEAADETEAE